MELVLRRLLGLYFVVWSFGYIPSALTFLAVDSSVGVRRWPVLVVPLLQGTVFCMAGLTLLRRHSEQPVPLGSSIVFPAVDALLQLVGVYFIVEGGASLMRPAVDMMLFTQSWWARFGTFMQGAVLIAGGYALIRFPQAVLKVLTKQTTAA